MLCFYYVFTSWHLKSNCTDPNLITQKSYSVCMHMCTRACVYTQTHYFWIKQWVWIQWEWGAQYVLRICFSLVTDITSSRHLLMLSNLLASSDIQMTIKCYWFLHVTLTDGWCKSTNGLTLSLGDNQEGSTEQLFSAEFHLVSSLLDVSDKLSFTVTCQEI